MKKENIKFVKFEHKLININYIIGISIFSDVTDSVYQITMSIADNRTSLIENFDTNEKMYARLDEFKKLLGID